MTYILKLDLYAINHADIGEQIKIRNTNIMKMHNLKREGPWAEAKIGLMASSMLVCQKYTRSIVAIVILI